MAERSNAAVLKTVDGQLSGGSNPSLSAIAPTIGAFLLISGEMTWKERKRIGKKVFQKKKL